MIRDALSDGLDADVLDDFLSRVDWSGVDRERPAIADLLGEIEGWTREYFEGTLGERAYIDPADRHARGRAT